MDATVSISFQAGNRIRECSGVLIASNSRKILVTNGHCLEIYLENQENEIKKQSPMKLTPNSATAVIKDTEVRYIISKC